MFARWVTGRRVVIATTATAFVGLAWSASSSPSLSSSGFSSWSLSSVASNSQLNTQQQQQQQQSSSLLPLASARTRGVARVGTQYAPVYRFVLTGGPCGGKTTAVTQVADRLRDLGFQVFVLPEVATVMHHSGVHYPVNGPEVAMLTWESSRLATQIALEDAMYRIGRSSGKATVILCDRGTMDTKAYVSPEQFDYILQQHEWSEEALRDRRYDGVVHMVTAAMGAMRHYTSSTEARCESAAEAIALDIRTRQAWLGFPHFHIVGNGRDFPYKMQQVSSFFMGMLGFPMPGVRRKFIVRIKKPANSPDDLDNNNSNNHHNIINQKASTATSKDSAVMDLPVKTEDCMVKSTFLRRRIEGDREVAVVLRKRAQSGNVWYSMTTRYRPVPPKQTWWQWLTGQQPTPPKDTDEPVHATAKSLPDEYADEEDAKLEQERLARASYNELWPAYDKLEEGDGQRILQQRQISMNEYRTLMRQADPTLREIRRRRRCFVWRNDYYELEELVDNDGDDGMCLLLVDAEKHVPDIRMPDFLEIEREITDKDVLYRLASGNTLSSIH